MAIVKILSGLLMLLTVFLGYKEIPNRTYELTCISNTLCGILLLADGILYTCKKKSIHNILYQCMLLCINVVFCCVLLRLSGVPSFNFSGAFFFLHVINPLLFYGIYLFGVDLGEPTKCERLKIGLISPVCVMAYALFDLVRFLVTGNFVYGLLAAEHASWQNILLIGIALYICSVALSNEWIRMKTLMRAFQKK